MEDFLTRLRFSDLELAEFKAFANENNIHINELFNCLSLLIAKQFLENQLDFDEADSVINDVWSIMLDNIHYDSKIELAQPAYDIYCAFDLGEHTHADGGDPVIDHAIPYLKKLLRKD